MSAALKIYGLYPGKTLYCYFCGKLINAPHREVFLQGKIRHIHTGCFYPCQQREKDNVFAIR